MNKNILVWRGTDEPPTKYHLWVNDTSLLIYNPENNLWESKGEGGDDSRPISPFDLESYLK